MVLGSSLSLLRECRCCTTLMRSYCCEQQLGQFRKYNGAHKVSSGQQAQRQKRYRFSSMESRVSPARPSVGPS